MVWQAWNLSWGDFGDGLQFALALFGRVKISIGWLAGLLGLKLLSSIPSFTCYLQASSRHQADLRSGLAEVEGVVWWSGRPARKVVWQALEGMLGQ